MFAPARDVVLGYVVMETIFYEDGRPSETTLAWPLAGDAQMLADEPTAQVERARLQAHANLDADLWPGETRAYGLAVVKSP